jgi:AcrR family transcriptional regulator
MPRDPAPSRELRARGQKTRSRLLDAGAQVFASRGYHAARVDDIVKLARTSHGTFYLYFENKEELFAALAGDVAAAMTRCLDEFPEFGRDARGRRELEAWFERFGALYRRHAPILRAWTEAEIAGDAVGRIGAGALARFVQVIADRFAAAPDGLDPQHAAMAVVAMIERAHYYQTTAQVAIPQDVLAATLARVTHAAVHGRG